MRSPLNKTLWSAGLCLAGAGLVLLAYTTYGQLGAAPSAILGLTGMMLATICFFTFFWALFAAIGYTRLASGTGVIGRWHKNAAEWDSFRARDAGRAAEHPALRNDLRIRRLTPPQGVDIIVGQSSIIVDGSYHSISGRGSGSRQMNWLSSPPSPECIEFPKSYPRSKGGSVELTLRVPVSADTRAEAVRVFNLLASQAHDPLLEYDPNDPAPQLKSPRPAPGPDGLPRRCTGILRRARA